MQAGRRRHLRSNRSPHRRAAEASDTDRLSANATEAAEPRLWGGDVIGGLRLALAGVAGAGFGERVMGGALPPELARGAVMQCRYQALQRQTDQLGLAVARRRAALANRTGASVRSAGNRPTSSYYWVEADRLPLSLGIKPYVLV